MLTFNLSARLTSIVRSCFKKELGDITDRLKRHAKVVDHTAVTTQLIQAAEFRKSKFAT